MLDSLRKTASGIIGFAIVGILVIAFAVWGIADIFTGFSENVLIEIHTAPPCERFSKCE